jgi:hypothetical protein
MCQRNQVRSLLRSLYTSDPRYGEGIAFLQRCIGKGVIGGRFGEEQDADGGGGAEGGGFGCDWDYVGLRGGGEMGKGQRAVGFGVGGVGYASWAGGREGAQLRS